jgi:hypothetical protein
MRGKDGWGLGSTAGHEAAQAVLAVFREAKRPHHGGASIARWAAAYGGKPARG